MIPPFDGGFSSPHSTRKDGFRKEGFFFGANAWDWRLLRQVAIAGFLPQAVRCCKNGIVNIDRGKEPWGLDRSYANSRRFLPTWRMNHTVAFQQPMPPKRSSAPVSAAIGNATSGGAVQPPSCMVTQGTSIPAKDISRDNNAAAGISAPLSRNTTASMLVAVSYTHLTLPTTP